MANQHKIGKEDLFATLRIFLTTTGAMVSIVGTAVGGAWVLTKMYSDIENRVQQLESEQEKAHALRSSRNSPVESVEDTSSARECPDSDIPAGMDSIGLDKPVQDSLTLRNEQLVDGSYYNDWILSICEASIITIDMGSSVFDSFIFLSEGLRDSTSWHPIGADDDGGDGLNSRLRSSVSPGLYTITANMYGEGLGQYTLAVRKTR